MPKSLGKATGERHNVGYCLFQLAFERHAYGRTAMTGTGFLAIWSSIDPALETEYLHWMTREHAIERVSVPGFLGVRMFRARRESERRYFILYRLADPAVVGSEAYLARLNAPTEWSSRIMPNLRDFVRGGGRVIAETGGGRAGVILPIACPLALARRASAEIGRVAAADRIVSARVLEVDTGGSSLPTTEKSMRTGESLFEALVVIEALDDAALKAGARALSEAVRTSDGAVPHDEVFALERADLAAAASAA
jgi:hypothetical protein